MEWIQELGLSEEGVAYLTERWFTREQEHADAIAAALAKADEPLLAAGLTPGEGPDWPPQVDDFLSGLVG